YGFPGLAGEAEQVLLENDFPHFQAAIARIAGMQAQGLRSAEVDVAVDEVGQAAAGPMDPEGVARHSGARSLRYSGTSPRCRPALFSAPPHRSRPDPPGAALPGRAKCLPGNSISCTCTWCR